MVFKWINGLSKAKAYDVQRQLWRQRRLLWPDGAPGPVEMLEPASAAQVLGVAFEYCDGLGSPFGFRGARFEVAGLLDRQASKIAVSRRFPRETVRFTGAHELGHWILHPGQVMHRDRPINGLAGDPSNRAQEESEADYFAACFLMPPNFLKKTFEWRFGPVPFVFDDASAFWLCPSSLSDLKRSWEANGGGVRSSSYYLA